MNEEAPNEHLKKKYAPSPEEIETAGKMLTDEEKSYPAMLRRNVQVSFEKFRLKEGNDPGPVLSDEEEFEMSKLAGESEEGLRKWNKHKLENKFRRNALFTPLFAAQIYLTETDPKNIIKEEKDNLLGKIAAELEKVGMKSVGSQPYVKEDVRRVEDLIDELKKYI